MSRRVGLGIAYGNDDDLIQEVVNSLWLNQQAISVKRMVKPNKTDVFLQT